MPDNILYHVRTWSAHNPDMAITIHDDASIVDLLKEWPELLDRYNEAPNFPTKKDIAQFAIVYTYGGLFVDVDLQCQKNVTPLLTSNTLLVFAEQHDNGLKSKQARPGLMALGAIPQHPLLRFVMKQMSKYIYKKGLQTPYNYMSKNASIFVDAVLEGWSELQGHRSNSSCSRQVF